MHRSQLIKLLEMGLIQIPGIPTVRRKKSKRRLKKGKKGNQKGEGK